MAAAVAPPPPDPAAVAPPPPDPAALIDELVEEFLLRLPPEDPALLARAALVSKQWYRVVTGPSFRRRFREFHRSTPLLGYIINLAGSIRFVPLSSFRPPRTHRRGVRAISSSHGRVLLQHRFAGEDVLLSVWDPITDEQQELPAVPLRPTPTRHLNIFNWDAAVICTILRCNFKVVFVGQLKERTFSCFYSSEAGRWSDPVFASGRPDNAFYPGNCVLIGTTLYTTCAARTEIFKYDLRTHQMCNICAGLGPGVELDGNGQSCKLIATEDGRLGVAKASNSTLRLWLGEHGRLQESRAIDLRKLLPREAIIDTPWVVAFAVTGAGVIFLLSCVGYFTIDLKSGSCKKVGEHSSARVVPYVSFCTPAPRAVSTDDIL